MYRTNQSVITPIGKGVVQGLYHDGGYLVRLPVNETTRTIPSTITPHANVSGLWVFSAKDLK